MYCSRCGAKITANSGFCIHCGLPASAAPSDAAGAAGIQETDSKAIISLVLGILSLTIFSIFAGIPAIILGHISRSRIAQSMGRLKGEGVALAGLIMGYLSLVAIPFILIIAAIAIPNLLRSRIAANEASAVRNIRSINMAAVTYSTEYPKVGYPAVLNHLGGDTAAGAYEAGLIDTELAAGKKTGYVFYYESFDSDSDDIRDQYFVRADPFTANSGKRSFCSDQTGIIRYQVEAQCTAESPPIQ